MGTELAKAGVVHFAIKGDVILDLCTAVDPMQDVALQILVNGIIFI